MVCIIRCGEPRGSHLWTGCVHSQCFCTESPEKIIFAGLASRLRGSKLLLSNEHALSPPNSGAFLEASANYPDMITHITIFKSS